MPAFKESNIAHFAAQKGSDIPVAVFIGGTSGVGEAMAHTFAQYTNGKARIAILGRNKEAGERILSELPKPDGEEQAPERIFIQCDVSLMRNVSSAVQQLKDSFSKINYLVISTGFVDVAGRKETPEGLESRLAVTYYSRWLFIKELLGLVEKAKEEGEEAAVMSMLASGYGGEINEEDWEVKEDYSTMKSMTTAATYNDLLVESFAERNPSVPFIHVHPGMVRTPIFFRSPSLIWKFIGLIVHTVGRLFTTSAEESADAMWNIIVKVSQGGGSYRMDSNGKDLGKEGKYFGTKERGKGLWEHTESAISRSLNTQL